MKRVLISGLFSALGVLWGMVGLVLLYALRTAVLVLDARGASLANIVGACAIYVGVWAGVAFLGWRLHRALTRHA